MTTDTGLMGLSQRKVEGFVGPVWVLRGVVLAILAPSALSSEPQSR